MSPPERIPTTCPTIVGTELEFIKNVLKGDNLSGKGEYSRLCEQWLGQYMKTGRPFVVSSCTSALEIAALLANIQPGDEVIFPSYTYVSSVNAFVLRGAVPVFVDLDDGTMNLDTGLIEAAITPKTRAIVPVHYAGVSCDMDCIMQIANKHGLFVCEDAAMGCLSTHRGRMLGTIGHVGCISFQEKKNITAGGQGGAILVNDPKLVERAEILYEHGTNRGRFLRGEVDRYQWLDVGVNATLSELQAAFLYAQLLDADHIVARRRAIWTRYFASLGRLAQKGYLSLPTVPPDTTHNANVFYIRVTDVNQRGALIRYLDKHNIQAHPQFMPLHSSPYGQQHGRFVGVDRITSLAASQILLLPLHLALTDEAQERVIHRVCSFWEQAVEKCI
ncbi:hypothetical protein FE257_005930 [Aspergillus nanangensis]|uniref:Uncharacterized protein n=1 Tax=Aspergillus nanangensis TaxID=2582783 RepID=A0AAD4CPV7_ASPNN|nr:hypothetical protein FE257_005930 [Aspergillus nanangensis]